jgi:hypothetical protein
MFHALCVIALTLVFSGGTVCLCRIVVKVRHAEFAQNFTTFTDASHACQLILVQSEWIATALAFECRSGGALVRSLRWRCVIGPEISAARPDAAESYLGL